ncbi:MAG: AhpC/TSA family protein [Bacteroidia bacterium]|nr:AhpC/TSA family protein [Bacteroidia bacterium]MDW8235918.1 TlpA disulfide reductase family protein [Bacteroidia bacterium]
MSSQLRPTLFRLGLTLIWVGACQSQPSFFTGEIQNFIRDSLYLFRWEAGYWKPIASTLVKGGTFAFKGSLPEGIYVWGISPQEGDLVVITSKEKPFLRGEATNLFQGYTYEKSPENEALLSFRREVRKAYEAIQQGNTAAQEKLNTLIESAKQSTYASVRLLAPLVRMPIMITPGSAPAATWQALEQAFWKEVAWNHPWLAHLPDLSPRLLFFWQNALSLLPEDSLLAYASAWSRTKPVPIQRQVWLSLVEAARQYQNEDLQFQAIEEFLRVAASDDPRRAQMEALLNQAGSLRKGSLAPDITLPDPSGQIRRLSELRGKWVLIDFWASWCRPCRIENPHVVRLYQKYHSRGFEILGVSLDYQREPWLQAIQQDNLVWVHVSDLKGWQSAGAQLYRVNSIPFTVLVDPQGRIAAKGLRGPTLEAKLQQIFP